MIEVLLVVLSLALGGTIVFFTVCQYFRHRLQDLATQHQQEKAALEVHVRELHQLVQTLAKGRPTST